MTALREISTKQDMKAALIRYLMFGVFRYRVILPIWLVGTVYGIYTIISCNWLELSLWVAVPLLIVAFLILMMASLVTYGFGTNLCAQTHADYIGIFRSPLQAFTIMTEVKSKLTSLGCNTEYAFINESLPSITKAIVAALENQSTLVLPSGFSTTVGGCTTRTDDFIFDMLMREALHFWLVYDERDNWIDILGNTIDLLEKPVISAWNDYQIPVKAQHYILKHFPEIVPNNPMRFSPTKMDLCRPGMSHVVETMKAVGYSTEEICAQVKEWLSMNRESKRTITDCDVPTNLV